MAKPQPNSPPSSPSTSPLSLSVLLLLPASGFIQFLELLPSDDPEAITAGGNLPELHDCAYLAQILVIELE